VDDIMGLLGVSTGTRLAHAESDASALTGHRAEEAAGAAPKSWAGVVGPSQQRGPLDTGALAVVEAGGWPGWPGWRGGRGQERGERGGGGCSSPRPSPRSAPKPSPGHALIRTPSASHANRWHLL
jgi:hypothetical protein